MKRPVGVFLVVLAGLVSQASANTISQDDNITISGGSLVLRAPKSDIGDYGNLTVFNYIKNDVSLYNAPISGAKLTTPLPTPTALDSMGTPFAGVGSVAGNVNKITLTLGNYDYLFLHWGGHGGGWEQLYYVGGLTGSYDFNQPTKSGDNSDTIGGLSFYSFYGPATSRTVPDGGMTVLLLGAALSGLGLVSRKLN